MLINKDPSETLSNCRQKDGQWEMPLSDRNYRNEQRDRGSFYDAKENTCVIKQQYHTMNRCIFYHVFSIDIKDDIKLLQE